MAVLVMDLGLIGYLLTVEDEVTFMMVALLLVMAVPLVGQFVAPDVLKWKLSRLTEPGQSPASMSSALAPLTCASSLAFVIFCSLLSLAPANPGQYPWLGLALWIYLIIQVLRMQQGMLGNILVSMYVLIKPARPSDRVYALAALLGAGGGLSLMATSMTGWVRNWLHQAAPGEPSGLSQFLAVLLLVWISFAYALMWGGALLWFTGRWQEQAAQKA